MKNIKFKEIVKIIIVIISIVAIIYSVARSPEKITDPKTQQNLESQADELDKLLKQIRGTGSISTGSTGGINI